MIPELTLDHKFISEQWKDPEDIELVIKTCSKVDLGDGSIPVYTCDRSWVNLGVFNEYKEVEGFNVLGEYGYCDTSEALIKYLKKYIDLPESYFVSVGLLSMDYEKYYRFGSYINSDGIDTGEGYPFGKESTMPKQKYDGSWIKFRFCITKLKK